MKTSAKYLLPLAATALAVFSTGCSMGRIDLTGESPIDVPAATQTSGRAMGGQQPIGGMTLQLYAAGTTGYGSAATPLGTSFTTTDAGNFTFPSFTCPGGSSPIFLLGTGGTVIAAVTGPPAVPATTNPHAELIVGLGPCSTYAGATPPFINMNELTSVATVYALGGFMSGPTNIGTSATTNAIGLTNAMANINTLVNTTNGALATPAANTTIPATALNTLADIMEYCINTDGTTACDSLFSLTKVGTTTPTETVTAMMNIAHNPAVNVAQLNQLRSGAPVFQTPYDVNLPPSDWTLAITYSDPSLSYSRAIAADQSGNVWVANGGNASVSEFSPNGTVLSTTATGYPTGTGTVPVALAIDTTGNVLIASAGSTASVVKLNGATGAPLSTVTGNGLSNPSSIAVDSEQDFYVGNQGTSSGGTTYSLFNSSGLAVGTGTFGTSATVLGPVAIALSAK